MNPQNKIVLAHKGFFSKEAQKDYRENSKEVCAISGKKDYISHIELDVRKSKDGILYCYHGSLWEYYFSLRIDRNFSYLKSKYHVDALDEILDVIDKNKIIVFDIKSRSITKEELLEAIGGKKFKDIVIGSNSLSLLKRFTGMSKFFWGKIFCNFYDLDKLQKEGFKYFDVVFPWQVNKRIINKVECHGMQFGCFSMFFLSKKDYWNTVNKYGLKRINSDFI